MAEWKKVRLGDIACINKRTYSPKEGWEFVNYLDTSNITRNRIDEVQHIITSIDKLPSRARRKVCLNSIVYSTVRPNQLHYGIIKKQPDNFLVSTGFTVIDVDSDKANPDFIYYVLTRTDITERLQAIAEQSVSAYPSIKPSDIENLIFALPDKSTQEKIASILSSIDRKIEANLAINDNLQQQAFSIFDNLIANAENNDCNVSDYAFLNPKRALAKNQMARSIDMSQLSTSGAFPSGWEMKPFNGGMRFANGDTLIARITPCLENGKTAFIDFLDDGEVAFGSTEYIVLAPKNDTPPEMLYCLARYPAFVDYAVKNMNGSSGRQRVSAETVGQYRLPSFDKHSLVLFKEVVSPMFLKMRYNSLENMRLAELRDALLPKLMSGEMDVSAVQL